MTERAKQKENTRRRIMEAAYKVYSAKGFSATTLMIAKEAGLSHGAVFVHFPSLSDLQICLVREFSALMGGELHGLSRDQGSIGELADHHLSILSRYEDFYIRLITEKSALPEEARVEAASMQGIVAHHFGIAIERTRARGAIVELKASMIFNTWIALLHYYMENRAMFSPDGAVLKRHREELIRTFLTLIQGK